MRTLHHNPVLWYSGGLLTLDRPAFALYHVAGVDRICQNLVDRPGLLFAAAYQLLIAYQANAG